MGDRTDRQRHVCAWLALRIQRQRLHIHLLACRDPVFRLDAGDDIRRPQRVRTANRLGLAIRIGIRGLEQQLFGGSGDRNRLEGQLAGARLVERQRETAGDHTLLLVFRPILLLIGAVRAIGLRRGKHEALALRKIHLLIAHGGRYLHRQTGGRPSRHVLDLNVHGQRSRMHDRARACRPDLPAQDGQPEFLDPEFTGFGDFAALAGQGNLVETQLGGSREREAAFGRLPAGRGVIPGQVAFILLTAADMRDHQPGRRAFNPAKAVARLGPEDVLHRYRFARAQE